MTLKVKVNQPHQTNKVLMVLKIHILRDNGDSRTNPWLVIVRTFAVKSKMTLKFKVDRPYIFDKVLKGLKIHILCKNGDSM